MPSQSLPPRTHLRCTSSVVLASPVNPRAVHSTLPHVRWVIEAGPQTFPAFFSLGPGLWLLFLGLLEIGEANRRLHFWCGTLGLCLCTALSYTWDDSCSVNWRAYEHLSSHQLGMDGEHLQGTNLCCFNQLDLKVVYYLNTSWLSLY